MSYAAMAELEEALTPLAADDAIAVVVLTGGVPGYFVAHADLEDLAATAGASGGSSPAGPSTAATSSGSPAGKLRTPDSEGASGGSSPAGPSTGATSSGSPAGKLRTPDSGPGENPSGDPRAWFRTLRLIEEMPQPVVAAVNGQAWGGGCELCLACTLRVAARSAHFAQPEVNLGIIPGAGGTQRLPRLIGPGRAAELVLTGRVVEAAEAESIGLVNAILPDEGFLDRALEWVGSLSSPPKAAVFAAKKALIESTRATLGEGLRLEGRLFAELQGRPEALAVQAKALERYAATPPDQRVDL